MLNLKKLLTKIIDHINPQQVGASGSVTVSEAKQYTVCSITLQPNSKYVVLASMASDLGVQHLVGCFIILRSGTPAENFGNGYGRTLASSGNGVTSWKYFRTGNSSITVDLRNYGYYTATTHTEIGHLFAWRIGSA